MSERTHRRAIAAALARHRAADDPDLIEARANLAEARVADYIERTVSTLPGLTPEACARLAMRLLTAASPRDGAA